MCQKYLRKLYSNRFSSTNISKYSKNPSAMKVDGFCRFIVIKGMRVKVLHPGITRVYVLYEGEIVSVNQLSKRSITNKYV